jgi:hypothetical protein
MKIKIDYYKNTGKWYEEISIEVPDSTELHDQSFIEYISFINRIDMTIIVDLPPEEQERLPNKFFKRMYR